MFDEWNKYIDIAKTVHRVLANESAYRTAVSRSYYAVYWCARDLIVSMGVEVPEKKSHDFVWRSYRGIIVDSYEVKQWGFDLRENRVLADYNAHQELTEGTSQVVMDDAEALSGYIRALSAVDRERVGQQAYHLSQLHEFL